MADTEKEKGTDDGGAAAAVAKPKKQGKSKPKPRLPGMLPPWKVLLHNDDYTTREFVVWVLQTVFHKNETDAIAIMSHVHNHGIGVAGVYTYEVAETKVTKTKHLAKAQQFPLQLSIEPTE